MGEIKTWQLWLGGIVFSVVMTVAGYSVSSITYRIEALENHGSPALRERISRLEADYNSLKQDHMRMESMMRLLDNKVDKIVDAHATYELRYERNRK